MKIKEFGISARAKTCLMNAGFFDVEDLENISDEKLLSIRNLNQKTVDEIRVAITDYFKSDDEESVDELTEEYDTLVSNKCDYFEDEDEDSDEPSNDYYREMASLAYEGCICAQKDVCERFAFKGIKGINETEVLKWELKLLSQRNFQKNVMQR